MAVRHQSLVQTIDRIAGMVRERRDLRETERLAVEAADLV